MHNRFGRATAPQSDLSPAVFLTPGTGDIFSKFYAFRATGGQRLTKVHINWNLGGGTVPSHGFIISDLHWSNTMVPAAASSFVLGG